MLKITVILLLFATATFAANNNKDILKNGFQQYLTTGKKPTAIDQYMRSNSLKHAFRTNPHVKIDNEVLCSLCEAIVDAAIEERKNGLQVEDLVTMIVDVCVSMDIESPEVCEGAIRANADPVVFIVDNRPELTGAKVCGTVLQGSGCATESMEEWIIDIPEGSTIDVEKGQQSSSDPIRILQLTDFHYDPNYLPGSMAGCPEPLCCQADKGLTDDPEYSAGFWGDYRDCDSPRHLLIDAYEHINRVHTDIDYIYFTGDIIRHKVWNTSVESNIAEIRDIFEDFEEHFPNTPIYPIFGNHEPHPVNVYAPTTVTDSLVSTQWLYDEAAELWSKWLPEDALETVKKGGYYSVLVRPGFRVIGINSNIYYIQNWWLLYDTTEPIEQLQWLADTLYEAEQNNEFVHILTHLPSGGGSAIVTYSRLFRRILERFSNTITALYQGHTHHDQWVVFHHADDNSPIAIVWDGGSLTTASNLNYNYKIYDVDAENFFVAHSNVQQLLASIWYEGLPGFRRKNMVLQALEIVRIGILFPFFSVGYIIAPHSIIGQTMRKPFIKFICNSASYFTFLFLLILASQRIETLFFNVDPSDPVPAKRGAMPSLVEWVILAWVCGLIWSEIKQLWDVGLEEYVRDMWNVIDFITNALYVATVALRVVSYYQVQKEGILDNNERKSWDAWDPMLISEGLFSAANIFSSLKLVYIFSVNPHLGPLQVSLSRMVMDIMKFIFLDVLVLFAFSCGLNQLLWYYAEAERQNCPSESPNANTTMAADTNACQIWRRFANLFETSQTLFWAVFGLIDLESFDLKGIKIFTRFWGMLMFGAYSVINIVVLLNLLIAMMNHSYQLISERADVEWKFARSKLWISYFEEGGTVPPPFNIVPTPKSLWYVIQWVQRKFCGHSRAAKKEHMRTIRRKVKQASERDFRYQRDRLFQSIMRNLVRRYVTVEQRKTENQGVTEDDVNEIKQDISAFRFELIEILKNSGMNTSTAHAGMGSGTGGKKNRQKERRLMKGFNIGPQPSTTGSLPPVAEFIASLQQHHEGHHEIFGSTLSGIFNSTPRRILQHSTVSSSQGSINEGHHHHHHHRGLGRLQMKRTSSHKRRWGTLIEAAKTGKVSRLIGRSRSEDSVCNSHCRENGHNHSHSNSPGSEDNITDSQSDSNPSLDRPGCQPPMHESHGLAAGLSLLKKKRKKFSASRNTSPVVGPPNPVEHAIAVCMGKNSKKVSQVLKRASSVPTRVPEVTQLMHRHEQTQSQQDSVELPQASGPPTLTPSTTEESVTNAGHSLMTSGVSSREPLLYNSSSSNQATGSSQTPEDEYRGNGAKLPGVTPLSGHNCTSGWL